MKIRLPHYIFGLFICITIYSFVSTSWGDRIRYLFQQYSKTPIKTTQNELLYQKQYVLQEMERHVASGVHLQTQVVDIQKKDQEKKRLAEQKTEAPLPFSALSLFHQYRLWQVKAKAIIGVLDKALLMRFQGKNASVTVEALTSIIAYAKKQIPEQIVIQDVKRDKELKDEITYAIEEQFALFFSQTLKNAIEEQKNRLTLKNSQQILLELSAWFRQDDQLATYLPLMSEGGISLFDALQMLLQEQDYLSLTKMVASLIEKVSIVLKDCSTFPMCLAAISFINKTIDEIATACTSTFEITGKNFTTIFKALTLYHNNLSSVVTGALQQGMQLKEGVEDYYALLVSLMNSLSSEQKKEHATALRSIFFQCLHRYVSLCDQKNLLETFSQALSVFAGQDSIALVTADGLPPKEIVPMRVLFLTLHARLNQCGGAHKIALKEELQRLQAALYARPKTQQEEQIKKELHNILVTQVGSLSDKAIKAYESNSKQFITLFLPDSYDVHSFFQTVEQKPMFTQQIDVVVQAATKDQSAAKRKFFAVYTQEFSNFVKEKYQFLQQLYDALTKEVEAEYKDKALFLMKEWIVREPMLYEQLRKTIRFVVLSKDERKKIELVNELKEQFKQVMPILVQLVSK